jgi:hypothetical protein|tara:strand:- start:678 stop:1061 length:384 start_codon:yes stop_codon:yes gene_type:complete
MKMKLSWEGIIWTNIILLVTLTFLAGCSITPKVKTLEVTTTEVAKLPLNLPAPHPLELQDVEWIIVTEENIEEVWQLLRDKNEGVALFALRHGDYESLSLNIKDIRAQLGEYIVILKKYKEYYESGE